MEVLKQLWRLMRLMLRGISALWRHYQSYRALRAQNSGDREALDSTAPLTQNHTQAIAPPSLPSDNRVPPKLGRWYAPSESLQIAETTLEQGWIYSGELLAAISSEQMIEPCLIHPGLTLETVSPKTRQEVFQQDWRAESVPLAYHTLSPVQRGLFIEWLAQGRQTPAVHADVLWLYLYGLERRIVELLDSESPVEERLALILELERLQGRYGLEQEESFCRVLNQIQLLIELAQVQMAMTCQPETLVALLPPTSDLSMALRVVIGRCIQREKPIPMPLLWAWYQSSSVAVELKTPAKRCAQSFNYLVLSRGESRSIFLENDENVSVLQYDYHPVSPSFGDPPQAISVVKTVDIKGLEPQLTQLEPLIEDCTEALDAYSRLIGRNPDLEGAPMAVALLPAELVLTCGNDQVQRVHQWVLDQLRTNDWASCSVTDLLKVWPTATPQKVRKKDAETLSYFLEKIGLGLVPDARWGQGTFTTKQSLILFRGPAAGDSNLIEVFNTGAIAMDLLLLLELQPRSLQTIESTADAIADFLELPTAIRPRLTATGLWRQAHPLTWRQAIARLKKMSPEQLTPLAPWITQTLPNVEAIDPVRLEELNETISIALNKTASQERPNRAIASSSMAETVSSAVQSLMPDPAPFVLDSRLIAQRHQESQEASGLLSEIFVDEGLEKSSLDLTATDFTALDKSQTHDCSDTDAPPGGDSPSVSLQILGLDGLHWQLLKTLGQKPCWQRIELEAIAQAQGLMLDGALENINEVAFDQCDEALTEGDDPIEINDWVYRELKIA